MDDTNLGPIQWPKLCVELEAPTIGTYVVTTCPPILPSFLLGLCFHHVLPLHMHWVFLVLVYFVLVKALVGSKIMITCSNETGTNQKKDARRREIA